MPLRSVSAAFTADGQASDPVVASGWVALHLSGTFTGQVRVAASLDGGTTWAPVSFNGTNSPTVFTAPCYATFFSPLDDALLRIEAPTLASGTANATLGQAP